jgi:death-on-curing protein
MMEPRWLTHLIVDVIHSEMLREHGGAPGVRQGSDDLIESALARPRNRVPESDSPVLAAAYLAGLAKNHGYVDGNKRVGFACAATFLRLNGLRLTASEPEAYDAVVGLVEGRYSEEQIAAWIRTYSKSIH